MPIKKDAPMLLSTKCLPETVVFGDIISFMRLFATVLACGGVNNYSGVVKGDQFSMPLVALFAELLKI